MRGRSPRKGGGMSTTTSPIEVAMNVPPAVPRLGIVRKWGPIVLAYVVSITVALALCAILVEVTGGSSTRVLTAMIDESGPSQGTP